MFKELGEFIDNVSKAIGQAVKEIWSDKEDIDGLTGDVE